jgi:hypothetical protein
MASKSERLEIIYNQIIEDLKTRDYSTYEIGKKVWNTGAGFWFCSGSINIYGPDL